MGSLRVYEGRCSGCRICEMACSMARLGTFQPRQALLRVEIDRSSPRTEAAPIDVPVVCTQCDPAPCSENCPVDAIVKTENGVWVVDRERCTGCGLCAEACPFGIAFVDSDRGVALKCDPRECKALCAEYCPTGAIRLEGTG